MLKYCKGVRLTMSSGCESLRKISTSEENLKAHWVGLDLNI